MTCQEGYCERCAIYEEVKMTIRHSFRDRNEYFEAVKEQRKYTNCDFCRKLFEYERGKKFIQCPHCGEMNRR